jgi:hypothetical protein
MSFERRFFFGCVQKDLEDSSGKNNLPCSLLSEYWEEATLLSDDTQEGE